MALLTSDPNIESVRDLVRGGLLDKVYESSKLSSSSKCLAYLCVIVSNVITNSSADAEEVLRHEVFGRFVLPQLRQTKIAVRYEAFFALNSMISHNKFNISEALVKKFQVLEELAIGL